MTKNTDAIRPLRTFHVKADDEILKVRATNIFAAFNTARRLRPNACVVSDTRKARYPVS